MSQIIDKRLNGKNKSMVNRCRFIERFKKQIKLAVTNAISKRSIKNIESGEKIVIKNSDISEPIIEHAPGGLREIIHPGNKEFSEGDAIKRPQTKSDKDQGNNASNTGEGEDEFTFHLTKEEFLDFYFDSLELPNLVKKQFQEIQRIENRRAGYTTYGVPNNINVIRSLRGALARRTALTGTYKKKLKQIENLLETLNKNKSSTQEEKNEIKEKIKELKCKISSIRWIDSIDIRYNNRVPQPRPSTQAVIFCLMDVSGSMDELKKDIAKRFFILLYLFLKRNYEKIEVIFIRHHTSAKEVNEEEFFYSRETGGTVVSSALETMHDIIQSRYPRTDWNIYAAQASDGDNWNADSPHCQRLLKDKILPYLQYFAYVEIMPRYHQSLWQAYLNVKDSCHNFAMQHINDVSDIYPIFRELFKRHET